MPALLAHELAQHTLPAFPAKGHHFPGQDFKVKQLHSSAIHLFLPYMSVTANVSGAGDISPPEPIFMMRDYPLYKSYENYVTTSGGFGIGAVHHLQLE